MAPAATTVSLSNQTDSPSSADGYMVGQSPTTPVGFYGTTPVTQPTAAAQAAITDTSGGTASATTGLQALTSSYNSTLVSNALSTLAAQTNAMRTALVNLGIMKGS